MIVDNIRDATPDQVRAMIRNKSSVEAVAAKLPKSIVALQAAFGLSGPTDGLADDLWIYDVASGNLTSVGDETVLTATGSNEYEVNISSDFDAGDKGIRYNGVNDGFNGPDASYGDPSSDIAHLFVLRLDATVPATRFTMHNFASGSGTKVQWESDDRPRFVVDSVTAQITTTHNVGQWYSLLCWFDPSTEVGLITEEGSGTNTVGVPASTSSTASWGLPGAGSTMDATYALAATFTGAAAAALRAAQHSAFSANAGLS